MYVRGLCFDIQNENYWVFQETTQSFSLFEEALAFWFWKICASVLWQFLANGYFPSGLYDDMFQSLRAVVESGGGGGGDGRRRSAPPRGSQVRRRLMDLNTKNILQRQKFLDFRKINIWTLRSLISK